VRQELLLLAQTPAACVVAVVLGLLWGSFANVCIYRWPPTDQHPKGRSVVAPGSHCGACKTPIRWYDNVPILSYLWLRGRCRACQAAFSPRYLLVEAVTGALFGVAWWFTLGTGGMYEPQEIRLLRFVIAAAFVFVLVVITFIDLDHKLILNKVTVPSIVLFYAASLALPGRLWWEGLVGIAVGYGVPWLIGEIYFRVTGREGLGLGDGMLLALVGALLGWRGVVVSLFGGSVIGSVLGITALVAARGRSTPPTEGSEESQEPTLMKTELPFGPFLAMAAVFYLFAEPWIRVHFQLVSG
jgi:leader peptidase (prepilin peptidase)/N-methyltransferase